MAIRPYLDVTPTLGPGAWVDETAQVIGRVELGADASVWPFVLIRGDVNVIRTGACYTCTDCGNNTGCG